MKSLEIIKMLRAIANAQSANKQEMLEEIKKVDNKLTGRIDSLEQITKKGFRQVSQRLDSQGKQLAYLEDDAPTRKEHDHLEKRVTKLENHQASV